jgi:hypothetical protein
MSGPDALHGEMSKFPLPGRPGGGHDEQMLDMIFERRPLRPGAPQEMHDLARMLAALADPAEPGELAGEAAALAAFRRLAPLAGTRPAAPRPLRPWRSRPPARGRARLAATLIAAVAGLGGTTAAYAGVLPGPVQEMAHVTLGAPAPHHRGLHPPAVRGPRQDGRRTLRPARPPAPGQGRKGGTAQAPGSPQVLRPGHGSPQRGHKAARCCAHDPSQRHNPPGRGPGDRGKSAPQATCCPDTAT